LFSNKIIIGKPITGMENSLNLPVQWNIPVGTSVSSLIGGLTNAGSYSSFASLLNKPIKINGLSSFLK